MIDCSVVLSWVKGGSQFVNQADVGGVYDGQWIMATSRWVTKVYAPSKPLPRQVIKRIRGPHQRAAYTFAFETICLFLYDMGREELFQMFKREKKVYLELTDAERALCGCIW